MGRAFDELGLNRTIVEWPVGPEHKVNARTHVALLEVGDVVLKVGHQSKGRLESLDRLAEAEAPCGVAPAALSNDVGVEGDESERLC